MDNQATDMAITPTSRWHASLRAEYEVARVGLELMITRTAEPEEYL